MERSFKRISDELKLPQESRERIRSQLASYEKQTEEIPMKKSTFKSRVPLIAVAVVMMMALTLTAAAAVYLFRNDIIVSSKDDVPISANEHNGVPVPDSVAVVAPNGDAPAALEEMIETTRHKSDSWLTSETSNSGVTNEYSSWDSIEVLSNDPALRSRHAGREDGAEMMEYTAEDPANLLDTLTGRVAFNLDWMNEQYDYVSDANQSFVVSDAEGNYAEEFFDALYVTKDGTGYIYLEVYNTVQADYFAQSYVVDGSYETAYYYTSADGYEFLIEADNGNVWAECNTSHTGINLHSAYLTTDEVEDILDHLSLTINE